MKELISIIDGHKSQSSDKEDDDDIMMFHSNLTAKNSLSDDWCH
jgi:hypothetical protein